MSKMSKAIAALGVVAGLGVAALPLSTYAAIPAGSYGQETDVNVQATVESAISIASTYNSTVRPGMEGETPLIDLGTIAPGKKTSMGDNLKITVTANQANAAYGLYIHTTNPGGKMTGKTTDATIDTGVPGDNISAWGYAYSATSGQDSWTYQAVPIEATPIPSFESLNITDKDGTNDAYFRFQVSASTTQPADTYTANVVFTAVVANP